MESKLEGPVHRAGLVHRDGSQHCQDCAYELAPPDVNAVTFSAGASVVLRRDDTGPGQTRSWLEQISEDEAANYRRCNDFP